MRALNGGLPSHLRRPLRDLLAAGGRVARDGSLVLVDGPPALADAVRVHAAELARCVIPAVGADEAKIVRELLADAGFSEVSIGGLFHGPRLREMDARHGGSIIDAQIARAVADAPWPPELAADVAAVTTDDFDIVGDGFDGSDGRDIDDSLDLIAIAVRP